MLAMQFGLYLKTKGVITAEQLVAALEVQHKRLVPIGQLAMEECVLSARDVFKVLRGQSDLPHERFGELAVSMGLMTDVDLQRLLVIQSDRKPTLDEVLVLQGVLTPAQMEEQLAAYRQEMEQRNMVIKRRIPVTPYHPTLPELPETVAAESYAMMI
jgi:hypothetical protein